MAALSPLTFVCFAVGRGIGGREEGGRIVQTRSSVNARELAFLSSTFTCVTFSYHISQTSATCQLSCNRNIPVMYTLCFVFCFVCLDFLVVSDQQNHRATTHFSLGQVQDWKNSAFFFTFIFMSESRPQVPKSLQWKMCVRFSCLRREGVVLVTMFAAFFSLLRGR